MTDDDKRYEDEQLITEGDSCVVHTASTELEAQIIEDALRDEGIPVMVLPNVDSALDGVFTQTHGWGRILVLERDRARAEEIVAALEEELEENAADTSEEEDEEEASDE